MAKWSQKLVLGIEEIDNQHRRLIELVTDVENLLQDIESGIDCYDEFMEILRELGEYTIYHFDYEEKYLKSIHFDKDQFILHQTEHQLFVKKVERFLEVDFDEDQYDNTRKMLDFLGNWVVHHILDTDAKYA